MTDHRGAKTSSKNPTRCGTVSRPWRGLDRRSLIADTCRKRVRPGDLTVNRVQGAGDRCTTGGVDYRYAEGNTLLVSSKGANVRVLQMQFADNKILNLDDLRKKNSEVDKFFAQ